MMRLVLAELHRLRSRRLTWIAVILIVLGLGVMQVAVYESVRPPSQAEVAEGQRYYEQSKREYEAHKNELEEEEKGCLEAGNPPEFCSSIPPRLEDFVRTPAPFAEITRIAVTVSVFLTGLAFLFVGASFIGGEHSSGALANWLSFIPERGKVFTSKLLALAGVAAVVNAAASLATVGVAALMARLADQPVAGAAKLIEMSGRGVLIAMIFAVLGFCVALLGRHTVASVGAVLGYLFISFVLSGLFFVLTGLQKIKPYLPENNLLAFLNHGHTYSDAVNTVNEEGTSTEFVERTITFAHSAGYWAVVVVALVGLSLWAFRRRDVN